MIESKIVALPGGPARISGRDNDGYFQNAEVHAQEMFALASLAHDHAGPGLILDIGGNIGLSAIALGRAMPNRRVMVFEPSADSAHLLRGNLAENGVTNAEVVEAAVSDRAGSLHLNETDTSGFSHILTERHVGGASGRVSEVRVVRLDDLVTEQVGFAKIDVEGHEAHVLAGMRGLLARDRPLVHIEFNPWCLIGFSGVNVAALATCLFRHHEIFVPDPDGGLAPIGTNAIGLIYRALVERNIPDIVLKPKPDITMPDMEEMTIPSAILDELRALRARA